MPNPPTTRFGLVLDLPSDTYDVDRTINGPFRQIEIVGALNADLTAHTGATAAHGATGAVVGTTNAQTLTNKTLTSPTISGTVAGGAIYTAPHLTAPVVDSGGLTVTAGGVAVTGGVTITDAASTIVPGATSLSLRNHANTADNLLVTDAGAVSIRTSLSLNGLSVAGGNAVLGAGNLANAATDGYAYIPTGGGVPSGTPTAFIGFAPIRIDTSTSKFWAYVGGVWKSVTLV